MAHKSATPEAERRGDGDLCHAGNREGVRDGKGRVEGGEMGYGVTSSTFNNLCVDTSAASTVRKARSGAATKEIMYSQSRQDSFNEVLCSQLPQYIYRPTHPPPSTRDDSIQGPQLAPIRRTPLGLSGEIHPPVLNTTGEGHSSH
ncbi:hypothetical protein E2C01_058848 [Portunus trituberculatus]|uniref:Uncharacterized protein n=1 Tax=Portunus trituberculatus TaxID=210409 RepID=A0A5B7H6K9_PORTR|nr:hypothetical protein [Portunus trituberculatus]